MTTRELQSANVRMWLLPGLSIPMRPNFAWVQIKTDIASVGNLHRPAGAIYQHNGKIT